MEIKSPEELMGNSIAEIAWHHGHCSFCDRRHTLILKLRDVEDGEVLSSVSMCLACLRDNVDKMLMGWMSYNVDDTVDKLAEVSDDGESDR